MALSAIPLVDAKGVTCTVLIFVHYAHEVLYGSHHESVALGNDDLASSRQQSTTSSTVGMREMNTCGRLMVYISALPVHSISLV